MPTRGQPKYPWDETRPGRSFVVELDDGEDIKTLRSRLHAAIGSRVKSHSSERYIIATQYVDGTENKVARGVRVWRKA